MQSRLFLAVLSLAGIAAACRADWTVTLLPAPGGYSSFGAVCLAGNQAGRFASAASEYRAAFWSGTPESLIDLTPAGATRATILCMTDTQQGGWAGFPAAQKAAIWSGTKASFVNLNPTGAGFSQVHAIVGDKQFGEATFSGVTYASAWSGSAASWVNLNPAWATSSVISGAKGDQQVGFVGFGHQTAALWNGTPESCVSLAPDGSTTSLAVCTDGVRQGGGAEINGRMEAGIWSGSAASWVSLHPKLVGYGSFVTSMTPSMQVGYFKPSGLTKACYWNGTKESYVDLHSLLPAEFVSSGASSVTSDGITDTILGTAVTAENVAVAVMWTRPAEVGFTFDLNKLTVAGQNSVMGTITLAETRDADTVFTTYDNSTLVTTPPTVTVGPNQSSKSFQIKVQAVSSSINTTLYAKRLSLTRSRPLTLAPLVPSALAFTPSTVKGGNSVACRIVLNGVAGPGGRIIAVFDNSAYTTMPATVTVPAGATEVTFEIGTTTVPSLQNAKVTARVSAGEKSAILRITP